MVKIEISNQDEIVYDLTEIGIPESELISNESELYFLTPIGFFPIQALSDFVISDEQVFIYNQDKDIFKLTLEQFKILKPLIEGYLSE